MTSLYDVLGVAADADEAAIEAAFRARAKSTHPDAVAGGEAEKRAAAAAFGALVHAREVLRDADARARYDRTGEADASPPDPDAEARVILAEIFDKLAGAAIDDLYADAKDIVALARHQIRQLCVAQTRIKADARGRAEKAARLLRRARGEILEGVFRQRIEDLERTGAEAARRGEVLMRADALIDGYAHDVETVKPARPAETSDGGGRMRWSGATGPVRIHGIEGFGGRCPRCGGSSGILSSDDGRRWRFQCNACGATADARGGAP